MYKIAQNFPVIVKQPLFTSTNLLKITQGSLNFCTKLKLHEFDTQDSNHEKKVSNKKESGKNIEVNTPAVIYLFETPTSSYPIDDNQVHTNSYQIDPKKLSNNTEPKSDVILLYGQNDDSSKENHDQNLSEKSSNSVLQDTELSNNDIKNVTKSELNQESNTSEKKKWSMYQSTTQSLDQNIPSEKLISTTIGDNRGNNEPKENLYTQTYSESPNPFPQSEVSTSEASQHLMRLEPFKTEILSSIAVKSTKKWETQQINAKLTPFTPPSKPDHETNDCFLLDQKHRTETKNTKPLITTSNNFPLKKTQFEPKIKTRNPLRLQNMVTFKGKSSSVNPNITLTNPVIETIRQNRLVNPTTGQNLYKKMAIDPLLKFNNIHQKLSSGDTTNVNDRTKSNMTPTSQKKDLKLTNEIKITFFPPPNPEISKVPNRTIAQNADKMYKNLFPASSNKPANLASPSKTTAGVAPSDKTAPTAPIQKTATVASTSRILANITSSPSKLLTTATIGSPNKIISPDVIQQQTKTQLKLNTPKNAIPSQEVTSQNKSKPTNTGGVQMQIPGRLLIAFTCKKCNTRNSKKITKHAYTKGVVIIRCDGCKNNHLIADNLNWFTDMGKKRNIEDIMAEKGEKVRKIDSSGGISEYLTES